MIFELDMLDAERIEESFSYWRQFIADSEVISTNSFASNRNGITMTPRLASCFVERFEDQVSDVVGLLTLIPSESHMQNCFTFVLKTAFIEG